MKITVQEELHRYIIKVQGNFGDEDCQVLQEALQRSTHSLSRQVLVDLNDLQNITTAGQRVLLSYSSQLQALHRPLVFFNVNPVLMDAFEDSGLVKVINIVSGLREAQALFPGR